MTLAQVQAAVALITFLIATWAGLIIAMALLLPKQTGRAELALSDSPVRSLLVGLAMLIPGAISVVMAGSPAGALKLIGFLALIGIGGALAIGSAGVALLMGRRISEMTESRTGFSSLIRGSVVYSLALGFPLIGWFLFMPVSLVMSLGSGTRALWRSSQTVYPPVTPGKPDYDVLERRGAI